MFVIILLYICCCPSHYFIAKTGGDAASSPVATSTSTTIPNTVASTPDYHSGSLCGILARVHQRISEPKLYNTVPYVCRGLPVWNCHVQPTLPTSCDQNVSLIICSIIECKSQVMIVAAAHSNVFHSQPSFQKLSEGNIFLNYF